MMAAADRENTETSELVGSEDIWAIVRTSIFILREQFWLILSGFVGGLLFAIFACLLTPNTYESKAKFAVDKLPFSMVATLPGDSLTEMQFLQSLVSSIPSEELSAAVAYRLGVSEKNVSFTEVQKKVGLRNPNNVNVEVAMVRGSRMGEIKATSSDPYFASKAANVVAEEISQINCISGRLRKIEGDILRVRAQVERMSQEVVATATDRIKLERQRAELQSYQDANGQISSFPAFSQDTTLNNLKTQLILVQGEYDGLARTCVRGSKLIGKRSELEGMKKQIESYAASLAQALKSSAEISANSEIELTKNFKEQQEYLSQCEQQRVTMMSAIGNVPLRQQLLREDPLLAKEQASVIIILNKANPSPYRKAPKPSIYIILGVLLGAGTGITLALLRHHIDRRMHFPSQIEFLGGTRCLAVLLAPPVVAEKNNGAQKATAPPGLVYLRSHILRAHFLGRQVDRIVAFNEIGKGTDSSRVVMELAVLLAKAEKKTLVVDLHFNGYRQAPLLGIEPRKSLGEWFNSEDPIKKYIQYSAVRQLALLHPGSVKGDLSDMMSRRPLGPFLEELMADWDFILIDAPPLLINSSLLMAAPRGTSLIAVANYNHAELDDLIEIKTRCASEGVSFAGVVLDHFPRKRVRKSNAFDIGSHRYLFEEIESELPIITPSKLS